MARATVDGLKRLRRPEDVARARGKSVKDVLPFRPAAAVEPERAPAEPEQAPAEPVAEETPAPAAGEETA
jgi:hypothetical protein